MSVKKLLILSAAGIAALGATAALAGGPDIMPVAVPVFQPKVYVQGNIGYAWQNWRRLPFGPFNRFGNNGGSRGNSNGGFTGGADIGYWFARNFAVETGAYWLPRVSGFGNNFILGRFSRRLSVSSWFWYAAGKITVPVEFVDNFDVYGKAGVFIRTLRYGQNNFFRRTRNNSYCGPLFALGGDYHINEDWVAKIQYMRVQGYGSGRIFSLRRAPAANLITVGLGYEFAV